MAENNFAIVMLKVLVEPQTAPALATTEASVALRTSSGSRRRSWPVQLQQVECPTSLRLRPASSNSAPRPCSWGRRSTKSSAPSASSLSRTKTALWLKVRGSRHADRGPMRLRQILFNLSSNAWKFTKEGEMALRASMQIAVFRTALGAAKQCDEFAPF
jgi:signal transduction histidine kinase